MTIRIEVLQDPDEILVRIQSGERKDWAVLSSSTTLKEVIEIVEERLSSWEGEE